jgi:large subunit ribosomal protein L25
MQKMNLDAEPRQASNKGAARQLRLSGKIPAVLYGVGEPQTIVIDERTWVHEFRHVTANTFINLEIGGETHQVLVKETQKDIVKGQVKHIDFYEIEAGRTLHVDIPVHLEGVPLGVKEGGILEHKTEVISVTCLPKDVPESFTLDISELELGDSFHVRDLSEFDGVEVKNDPAQTVVVVSHPKAIVEEVVEEEEGELEEGEEGVPSEEEGAAVEETEEE